MAAHYDYAEFTQACVRRDVLLYKQSQMIATAAALNLFTKNEILDFVARPPDHLEFSKSRQLEHDIFRSQGVPVDSYYFGIGEETWYLSIMKTAKTTKWVLKSFKPSDVLQGKSTNSIRGNQMQAAMLAALESEENDNDSKA